MRGSIRKRETCCRSLPARCRSLSCPSSFGRRSGSALRRWAVACVVMAGSAFGNEFQHRTLSLLLSQPIARSALWRDKMLVLGAGMLMSLAALLVCLAVSRPAVGHDNWLVLVSIPLCAFCGAPFWTLSLRHSIGGMVAAVGAPLVILAGYALLLERLGWARQIKQPQAASCCSSSTARWFTGWVMPSSNNWRTRTGARAN